MNNNQPLVSICCITYNHAKYIKKTIDSFLMQKTNFSFEICIGEDESNDGTREICLDYAEKYPNKIKLFLRKREDVVFINDSPTGRYNFLETINQCKGKYIALCEGDDCWTDKNKLKKQVDFLEKNDDYVLVYSNCGIINETDKPDLYFERYYKKKNEYQFNFNDSILNKQGFTCSKLFKNIFTIKEIKYFLKENPIGDWPLECLLMTKGKGYFMADIMSDYRIHNKNMTFTILKNKKNKHIIKSISRYIFTNQLIQSKIFLKLNKDFQKKTLYLNINSYYRIIKNMKYSYITPLKLFKCLIRIIKYKYIF